MIAPTFENLLLCLIVLLASLCTYAFHQCLKTPELYPHPALLHIKIGFFTVLLVGAAAVWALLQ